MSWYHRLTDAQWAAAKLEAQAALEWHQRAGHPDSHGAVATRALFYDALGVAGEIAFSAMTGLPRLAHLHGPDSRNLPDFAPDLETRTRSRASYDLIIRPADPLRRFVLLVLIEPWAFEARGWMHAGVARQQRFLQTYGDRPAAYFVPQVELWSMNTLQLAEPQTQPLPW